MADTREPNAEPVAQQPPPREPNEAQIDALIGALGYSMSRGKARRAITAIFAAQQPEAPPTQDDDLVARLNGLADNWPVPVRDRLLVLEAAARIESDDQIITSLRAEVARLRGRNAQ